MTKQMRCSATCWSYSLQQLLRVLEGCKCCTKTHQIACRNSKISRRCQTEPPQSGGGDPLTKPPPRRTSGDDGRPVFGYQKYGHFILSDCSFVCLLYGRRLLPMNEIKDTHTYIHTLRRITKSLVAAEFSLKLFANFFLLFLVVYFAGLLLSRHFLYDSGIPTCLKIGRYESVV